MYARPLYLLFLPSFSYVIFTRYFRNCNKPPGCCIPYNSHGNSRSLCRGCSVLCARGRQSLFKRQYLASWYLAVHIIIGNITVTRMLYNCLRVTSSLSLSPLSLPPSLSLSLSPYLSPPLPPLSIYLSLSLSLSLSLLNPPP